MIATYRTRTIPTHLRERPSYSTDRRTTTRIDDPSLEHRRANILFIRGAGPIGYPGSGEVVNMQPPAALITRALRRCLYRGRPPVGHVGLALNPQRIAGGGGRRRAGAPAYPATACESTSTKEGRHSDIGGRARQAPCGAAEERRLPLPAEPDAVAGNPARHGRPTRRRHGAQARGQVSAGRADIRAAGQSLTVAVEPTGLGRGCLPTRGEAKKSRRTTP